MKKQPNSSGAGNLVDPTPLVHPSEGRLFFHLRNVWIVGTVVFLVLFPKGGIKLANAPITWGYLLLGMSVGLLFVFGLFPGRLRLPLNLVFGYLITVPFAICVFLSVAVFGGNSFGFIVALLVVTWVLPAFFFLSIAPWLKREANLKVVLLAFRRCIFLVAVFGIFSFGYYALTKKVIEVPYLTVNAADQNSLLTKNNRRGDFQKLVSTYNNGNIYAVCMVMFLPLYCVLERRASRQWLVKASIVFTLSRTAWFGLFICEFFMLFFQQKKRPRTIVFTLLGMAMAGLLILVFLNFMGRGADWLADSSLGGRSDQLPDLQDITLFASTSFQGIAEILPLSVLRNFGIVGFLLFALAMASPLIGFLFRKSRGPLAIPALLGCLAYCVMSISDGAYLLIPVMAFYWFLAALVWVNPSENPSLWPRR